MCGISGFIGLGTESDLRRMTDALAHRGPDAAGYWTDPALGIYLGHRRLSILDLGGGGQPMVTADGGHIIIFNGEIYNFAELRADLVRRGHRFTTAGDGECLVHLYEEFGIEGCLHRLIGMFSFALYDRRVRHMLLARDRIGVKPLYIAETPAAWYFASEAKAFADIGAINHRLDETALLDALVFGYVPAPRSIFRGISKLPAGSYAILANDRPLEIRRYWDLSFVPAHRGAAGEVIEELDARLHTAVRRRLVADVPLGAFLSSGLDSSVVVALMTRTLGATPVALTAGFAEASFDERPGARVVAQQLGLRHIVEEIAPSAQTILPELARTYDEPFFDSSALPTYLLCRAARRHVVVALSGDGGDESFAGYRRYAIDVIENRIRARIPAVIGGPLFRGLSAMAPQADWLPRPLRGKTFLANLARAPVEAYSRSVARLAPEQALALLSPELRPAVRGYSAFAALVPIYERAPAEDPLSRIQYLDFHTWLPDDILCKVDRASMAHGLEVREPLLDHELVEMVAQLPWRLKLRGRERKAIFKEVARRWLPEDVIQRPKQGFEVPLRAWMNGDLRAEAGAAADCPLLDASAVRAALAQHQRGGHDRSVELWSAIMLNHWYRTQ